MANQKKKNDLSKLTFEESIKELTNIVGKIEQGEIPLQDSLEQYKKGMTLIKHCRDILQKAEKQIEKITEADMMKNKNDKPVKKKEPEEDVPF